jgi:hypothetical protein
VFLAGIFQPFL